MAKIFIFKGLAKKLLSAPRLGVCRRYEPTLDYVPKIDGKQSVVNKRLLIPKMGMGMAKR